MGFYRLVQRWPLGLLLGLAVSAGGACNSSTGSGLKLRITGTPAAQGCLQPGSLAPISASALLQSGSLRVSVVRRDADGAHLVCDASARVPSESLSLDLGNGDTSAIDYYAEFFDANGAKLASGALLYGGASKDPGTIQMSPVAVWSCPPSKLGRARAFHSATLLPNGEVLLLGGVAELPASGTDVFGLVDNAEVYDPRIGQFVPLTVIQGTLTPRAFHTTAVVSSDSSTVQLMTYGGISAPAGQPALFVPDSPTQLRLMPGGSAQPATAEVLIYDSAARTLQSSRLGFASHRTAFAGGAVLPGGGLITVGGSTFSPILPFERSNPLTLNRNVEVASFFTPNSDPNLSPIASFGSGSATSPWMLGASVTPLSQATAIALGAKLPPDTNIQMQAVGLRGLPSSVQIGAAQNVGGASTVFHTATLIGALAASGANAQVLVTGGFVQDSQPPFATRQPPTVAQAVRLYNVSDAAGGTTPVAVQSINPYMPSGTCGMDDGHYRPAGWEAATATVSNNQVLITGGTPTVPTSGCADCESTEMGQNKLLCVLRQASLYDATSGMLTALPSLPLGRMGHQQTRLLDGNILLSGGLVRAGGITSEATAEAEIYNPLRADTSSADPNDPLAPILTKQGLAHTGTSAAQPCSRL